MKKYKHILPGEEVVVSDEERQIYYFACCDCCMVHKMRFTVNGKKISWQVWRDNRRTAGLRRYRGIPIIREKGIKK